ncbi:hypothetical protein ACFLZL_00030 [Thermodesulfobacteriota bacterium]
MWLILAANNIGKLPLDLGFDATPHLDYIRYIAEEGRIPYATEGWEMFNPPFYYIITALFYKVLALFFSTETAVRLLRIISLFCGAAQIEISYRLLSLAYRDRKDLQILGIVIGGLLPMNIYISQVPGNEPLTALLSGVVILLTFKWLLKPSDVQKNGMLMIGLVAGVAVLTKVTAIILIPVVIVFVIYRTMEGSASLPNRLMSAVRRFGLVSGIIVGVAGWYYIRNFMEMGHFFAVGGWDVTGEIEWWQEPGFRTFSQLASFGNALVYPIYSGLAGLWDSFYSTLWMDGLLSGKIIYKGRPPWNYAFMLASAWLSFPLTLAMIIGVFKSIAKPAGPQQKGFLFLFACFLGYGAAFFYLYLTLPVYSAGKATYLLGIAPCLVLFCVEGFEILIRTRVLRAAVNGLIACWAIASYLAYFVVSV